MNKSELKLLRQEEYKDNIVTTSKYNFITFLPINLFQQLSKAANIYFCLITVLQTIKVVSISGGEPTMLPPLVLVVLVSMCKDAYEDYCRHCEDAYENKSICTRFNKDTNTFEKVFWGEVQVGDFIRVKQDEFFPADMLVVRSTEDEGVCYVETKNLDGETNLKNKVVPKDLWSTF
jgi:phospholipid-transporting ATPase|mmetsp:Transcript_41484/g.54587  ORF Transcript_41484/g.54587 Transcript_41484/m.54587 type:complete len:176 (+) Transcript_41484:131-658(+)